MRTKKLVLKFYKAILEHDKNRERKYWFKLLRKSLQQKHTEVIR